MEYFSSRKRNPDHKISFYSEGMQILTTLIKSLLNIKTFDIKVKCLIHEDFIEDIQNNLNDYNSIRNFSLDKNNKDKKIKNKRLTIEINKDIFENFSEYLNYLKRLNLNEEDYFLITAPETNNILAKITQIMEDKGLKNLGSSAQTVKKTANKWLFHKNISDKFSNPKKIKTPKSELLTPQKIRELLSENNSAERSRFYTKFIPAVIKETYSAGSELKIVQNKNDLQLFLKNNYNSSINKNYLIQKIIEGIPGSISAVADKDRALILSINKQYINKNDFQYHGGEINYPFNNIKLFKKLTKMIKEIYPGLNGYFGIDFIYSQGEYYLLEINPRLTSSIIGINELFNITEYIISANNNTLEKIEHPLENNKQRLKFFLE